ncbi:MAG: DUF4142 domain-containing protein [Pseudomonadota bacterium]
MTRTILLAGAAALALTLGACKRTSDEAAMGAPDANPEATIPTAANEAAAPDFVAKAAEADMFTVESSRVALERSQNAAVKEFARMMVAGHTQTTADLKAAVAASGLSITTPEALPADKLSDIARLREASPADFDRAYMDAQVAGHQATLDLMARYAQDGDNASLKAVAAAAAPAVQQHLDRAKAIRDGLG